MSSVPVLKVHTWDVSFREKDNVVYISSNPECFEYGYDKHVGITDIQCSSIIAIDIERSNKFLIIKGLYKPIRVDTGSVPIWKMKYGKKVEGEDRVLGELI